MNMQRNRMVVFEKVLFIGIKIAVVFVISLFLLACSRDIIRFIPVKVDKVNQSVIYIYRQNNFSNIVISPGLLIDGVNKISIKNNSYVSFFIKPGKHNIKLELNDRYEGQKELDIQLDGREVSFYEITTKMKFKLNQPYERRFDIRQVESDLAIKEIQNIPSAVNSLKTKYTISTGSKDVDDKEEVNFSIQKTSSPFSK